MPSVDFQSIVLFSNTKMSIGPLVSLKDNYTFRLLYAENIL